MADEQTPLLGASQYSVWTQRQKLLIIIAATAASIFSPLAANIYYPALIAIREELGTSEQLLNITITSYMIFQGISPTFVASLSDTLGRRPVYIFCFVIYTTANIALAFQKSFLALLLLRCLQSSGIASTVNLAYAVTADVVTSDERGRYIGFASVGPIVGPSLGPMMGGFIAQKYGWRYIFIFLAVASSCIFIPLMLFMPETARNIAGNGSIPPSSIWNKPLWWLWHDGGSTIGGTRAQQAMAASKKKKILNPFRTLGLLFEYPTGSLLFYNGFSFAVYYAVTSSLAFSFYDLYHFDNLQVGLAYLPVGLGTMLAALGNGVLVDWNFRRLAAKHGLDASKGRNIDPDAYERTGFSFERARLQITLPMIVLATIAMLAYSWSMDLRLPPWVPLLALFVFGMAGTAAYTSMNVLIIDLHTESPAMATAANNLVRCLLGSAATAVTMPLIHVLHIGGAFSLIAGVWALLSPLPVALLFRNRGR
ncbi:putative bicyclomycin resistance protein [Coleophoma crateriformis]|uniref:Putative bicyclomycin resistance protein n=1 Tax=Coleophoma crateriformis TaxID=565419 RepID=A0A3D8Q565_9HELO|nr:putative bicyclomycin resistance protein [Coleophoma crateriformis]